MLASNYYSKFLNKGESDLEGLTWKWYAGWIRNKDKLDLSDLAMICNCFQVCLDTAINA